MASAAAADTDELPEDGNAKPAKSKKKLFIYGGGGAGLIVVLALVYFMFFAGGKAVEKAEAKSIYFDLPEMTVNLSATSERPQYLRVKITLEMTDSAVIDAVKTAQPRVIDAFQVHLRELRSVDLEGSAGIYRLREELMRRINLAIAPSKIRAVLFKEIVVQ